MRTLTMPTVTRIKLNKSIAVGIWLVGAMFTSWFWQSLGIHVVIAGLLALFVQAALTKLQSPLHKGVYNPVTIGSLAVDALLFNAAGLWEGMRNFGQTNTWKMLAEWTGNINTTGVPNPPHVIALVVLTITLAVLTALTAELIWNQAE